MNFDLSQTKSKRRDTHSKERSRRRNMFRLTSLSQFEIGLVLVGGAKKNGGL